MAILWKCLISLRMYYDKVCLAVGLCAVGICPTSHLCIPATWINFLCVNISVEMVYMYTNLVLIGLMEDNELDKICICVNDLIPFLIKSGYRVSRSSIKKVLREIWKLTPIHQPTRYQRLSYLPDGSIHQVSAQGRYYQVERSLLMEFCWFVGKWYIIYWISNK